MDDETHPCDYVYPVAPGDVPYWRPGTTLRDYFAGQAIAASMTYVLSHNLTEKDAADAAYAFADAMMEARK